MSTQHVSKGRIISTSEVARQVGLSPAQLGIWLASGKLERPKMGVVGGRFVYWWTETDIERVRAYKAVHSRAGGRGRAK